MHQKEGYNSSYTDIGADAKIAPQKEVFADLWSKQILPFAFARQTSL